MAGAVDNPYPGLRAFVESEAQFFFGREREGRELLSLAISDPLTLFYAQSGAGKTSLLQTRLIPSLRKEGFEILPVGRVGGALPRGSVEVANAFVFSLILSLHQHDSDIEALRTLSLSDYLQTYLPPPTSLPDQSRFAAPVRVLIIDQFEEIVTTYLERWPEREDFFKQLRQTMEADSNLWVILTMREDYVAALEPYTRSLKNKLRTRFHMQPMGYQAALEAVARPAELAGCPFAPGVAEMLVERLREIRIRPTVGQGLITTSALAETYAGEFVEPLQLQAVCHQLWQRLKSTDATQILQEHVEAIGEVEAALAQFYEAALEQVVLNLDVTEVQLRNWFERQAISELGSRRSIPRGREMTAGLPNEVVELLKDQLLLQAEVRAGDIWYELIHELLIAPIVDDNQAWRLLHDPALG